MVLSEYIKQPLKMLVGEDKCLHIGNRVALVREYKDEEGETCEETVAEVWPGACDIDIKEGERFVRACNAHEDLLKEMEETNRLALELMERAAKIDELLLQQTGRVRGPGDEIGQITRMRQQIDRNLAAVARAAGRKEGD